MSNIKTNETRSLYDLALDLVELDLDAPENEMIVKERLNQLGTKVNSYVALDKFCDSQIEMLKKEVEHYKNQIKKFENIQERLKDRAMAALETLGCKELKSDNGHKMLIRESKAAVVESITKLPDWAKETTVSVTPKKLAILEALKNNEHVPGARLEIRKNVNFK